MEDYNLVQDFIDEATKSNKKISEVVLEWQAKTLHTTEEKVYEGMLKNYRVMKTSIEEGLKEDLRSVSGLTGGMAYKMKESYKNGNFSGSFMGKLIYSALSVGEVNACMGCIVAAPTAGSCGIIPACLYTMETERNIPEHDVVMALVNASGIGYIIAKNASISGAEGGCQAECGSAAAMIASGMVEILGGTPEQCGDAVAQALKMLMGLVCDPVAGLVEEPCVVRNAGSATIAVTAAELTLAGIKSIIPVDEVISAMDEVGKLLPTSLKETAKGGVATTPTGQRLMEEIFEKK